MRGRVWIKRMMHHCLVLVQRTVYMSNSEVNGPPLLTMPVFVSPLQSSARESAGAFRSLTQRSGCFLLYIKEVLPSWVIRAHVFFTVLQRDLRDFQTSSCLRDPASLPRICRDVRSLLHSILKEVCLMSARIFTLPPWIHRFLHPTNLEPFHFILRTSRNTRCLKWFSPRVRQHSLAIMSNIACKLSSCSFVCVCL